MKRRRIRVPFGKQCRAAAPKHWRRSVYCTRRKGHTGAHQAKNDHRWEQR